MSNLRRIGLFSVPLRAAFALVFLIFSSAQPSLFATSGVQGIGHGLTAEATMFQPASMHEHGVTSGSHDHGGKRMHADADDGSATGHDSASAGKSCEVHCAPAHAMPVACPEVARAVSRCFVALAVETLPRGEYTVHIRPPRHLI
jgi:hypothetical protein